MRARRTSEMVEHREERLRDRRVRDRAGALIRRLPRLLRRERPDYKQPETDEQLSHQRRERPGYKVLALTSMRDWPLSLQRQERPGYNI